MDAAWMQSLLAWVTANPGWAYLIVFAVAFIESIFILGLIVPGAFMLFGVGALVPTGAIELGPTLLSAIVGAVAGDCFSYALGRRFRTQLYEIWPLRNYPALIARGEMYFIAHGGKSVLLGRFVGAVRPIIPTIAGVAGMRPLLFITVDVLSAIAWAPCYILPGVVVGASLGLAAEVASRMVVVLLVVGATLALVIWVTRRVLIWLPAHAEELVHGLLDWSRRHRMLGRLGRGLADPTQPETPALAIIALVLLAVGWLSLYLLWGFAAPRYPVPSDAMTYQLFQELRSPLADHIAMAIAQLGDWEVYLPLSIAVLVTLLIIGQQRAAAHWIAGLGFGAVLAASLSAALAVPVPIEYYRGETHSGFAGGHSVFAAVVYGFLPVLLASRLRTSKRWRYYVPFFALVVLIALARLYLGAQWLSDTLLGLTLGLLWVALLTLGYRRHRPQWVPQLPLLIVAFVAIAVGAGYQWSSRLTRDLQHYAQRDEIGTMPVAAWRAGTETTLPSYRVDLRGKRGHPLNLQWIGALSTIDAQLQAQGWQRAPDFGADSALLWLTGKPDITRLPVLPQVHDGEYAALTLRYPVDHDQQWLIRLWPSDWRVVSASGESQALWIGYVSRQRVQNLFRVASAPFADKDFDEPRDFLQAQLAAAPPARRAAEFTSNPAVHWDGTVLLLGEDDSFKPAPRVVKDPAADPADPAPAPP